VREDKVRHYFDLLKTKLNHERERNKYVKIVKFFEKKYINVSDENLRFWNAYNRVLAFLPRTTNALEGFHRAINKLFSRAKPDLGYFGEKLH
jgi:predicted nuclease of restriction endonuclease-like RecB superfamily